METRVERYRELRQEIQSSSGEEVTTKKKTAERVSSMLSDSETHDEKRKIPFDKIADAYELYDKGERQEHNPLKTQKKPFPVVLTLGILFAALLVVGIIFILIMLYGGNK